MYCIMSLIPSPPFSHINFRPRENEFRPCAPPPFRPRPGSFQADSEASSPSPPLTRHPRIKGSAPPPSNILKGYGGGRGGSCSCNKCIRTLSGCCRPVAALENCNSLSSAHVTIKKINAKKLQISGIVPPLFPFFSFFAKLCCQDRRL